MKGKCVDTGATTTLELEKEYYLFENGESHVYVSLFNNANAHIGCYQKRCFEVIPESETKYTPVLDRTKRYVADLVQIKKGYTRELKTYYLIPLKTHAHFYSDEWFKEYCGCFPLEWFANFSEVLIDDTKIQEDSISLEEENAEETGEWEQLSLF